ncbi:hypothetical protein GCM10023175_60810 [Pseudonocardia xishanensis]|uniref:Uncharacterized protein n=1 Tax=Pseudonocardia xishanensis TaxID=630995 RepID=A0ABP8S326_9PSEU
MVIAGNGDGIFRRLMTVLGRPDLADDSDLGGNAGRWARRDELDEAVGAWTAARPRAEVLAAMDRAEIPAEPIYTAADICADPQFQALNMIQYFAVDTGGAEDARVGFPGIVPAYGDVSCRSDTSDPIWARTPPRSWVDESASAGRDVARRLQLSGHPLPTSRKVDLVRELLATGVPELEIGSLARPDLVPPLADTLDVVAALEPEELERCWLWVATPRHVERAMAVGARNVQYCLSVSDAHNRANIGRDTEASLAARRNRGRAAPAGRGWPRPCGASCPDHPHTKRPRSHRARRVRHIEGHPHRPYAQPPPSIRRTGASLSRVRHTRPLAARRDALAHRDDHRQDSAVRALLATFGSLGLVVGLVCAALTPYVTPEPVISMPMPRANAYESALSISYDWSPSLAILPASGLLLGLLLGVALHLRGWWLRRA